MKKRKGGKLEKGALFNTEGKKGEITSFHF